MAPIEELPRVRRGPLDSLYAALRRRAPQMSTARPGEDGVLHVSYRARSTTVTWDDDLKQYAAGLERFGPDAEKAAELIAWSLGAPGAPSPGQS
ncbi:hypothetical protein [Actinomadura decatromicini]|uniref:Uncharacterized protein n=1 Tax=Actinomadura decatromicini TaxID=2604572 RepID=A0A5D3FS51_9ACTN|nr:hypothetical protein [Actinomadura decatromicini]TYK50726.1 hypothetical protein FXF68_09565 [Actinomadura decatromicini]